MEIITPDQLSTAFTVLFAIFAAIVTVDKVIDIIRKWRFPSTATAKKLANDKVRLDSHDDAIKALKDSNRVLCNGVMALLDHELHNGNADQMQRARDGILEHLQGNMSK